MIAPAVLDAAMELLVQGHSTLAQNLGLKISEA
jgi:glycine oxidase